MENILLLLVVALAFVAGYFVMKRIDGFLLENERQITKETKVKDATYIIISSEKTMDEIDEEIKEFKRKHNEFKLVLMQNEREEILSDILDEK